MARKFVILENINILNLVHQFFGNKEVVEAHTLAVLLGVIHITVPGKDLLIGVEVAQNINQPSVLL